MDPFQQLKGVLGHELVKAWLMRIRNWEVSAEEAEIVGLDGRCRIDLVAHDGNNYRPIEVKLQRYRLKQFGAAATFIQKQVIRRRPVLALVGERQVELRSPVLALWDPPANGANVRGFEIIYFNNIVLDLRLGNLNVANVISNSVSNMIERFFQECFSVP